VRISQTSLIAALALGAGGCGSGGSARPAVAAPCSPSRIGEVTVTGATPAEVPALAVLQGTHDDPARTERVVAAAVEALRWRGYAKASIDVAREAGCFVDLQIAVELGPRFKIARIDFQTDDEFPAGERLAAIEDALGTVNTIGGVHIEYRLRRALDGLERRYRDAGWLDAKIGAPRSAYDEIGAVRVAIPVDAGPRYRIGAIRARGANAIARRTLLEELGLDPGTYYDGPALRRGIERARRKLDRGVELRTSLTDGDEIEIEAEINAEPVRRSRPAEDRARLEINAEPRP
jgi:outer membrane protein assembly factor BamA